MEKDCVAVYVIVVLYNGAKWIGKCFDSLRNSTIPVKIIAIDNCSKDNSVNLVKINYPEIRLIEAGENLGFGRANNIGLAIAIEEGADYVFLLNQDAYIQEDTIEKLIYIAQKNKNLGIISPIHLDGSWNKLDYNFSTYLDPNKTPSIISDALTFKVSEYYLTTYVNAAAWLITKECILKVGGFDPIFPHYGEDDDYLQRTIIKGYKIALTPSAFIAHDRIHQPNSLITKNFKRKLIHNTLILKDLRYQYKSNINAFIINQVTDIFKKILFRQFRLALFILRTFMLSLLNLNKIRQSRSKSLKDVMPFLEADNNFKHVNS
ncbi:glycosyltransferase family 2 protein [Pontibacter russatus]|uniref:glycosyltransferase family 2 protein n=1 Tax=Pontibacter russatus TaxID=2694929 RepID=UPI001379F75A|nr:glycosyltransferase family 2 protein [Pontibacter russatus]